MQLGEWIKAYRKEQGLSMQNFADLCGFSKAYVGQLEKGINPKTKRQMSPTMQLYTASDADTVLAGVGVALACPLRRLDTFFIRHQISPLTASIHTAIAHPMTPPTANAKASIARQTCGIR